MKEGKIQTEACPHAYLEELLESKGVKCMMECSFIEQINKGIKEKT